MLRKQFFGLLGLTLAAGLVAGCGNDTNEGFQSFNPPAQAPSARLRAVHAASGTGPVDVFVDETRAINALPFGSATPFARVAPASVRVRVGAAGQPASAALIDTTLNIREGLAYSPFAIGSGSSGDTRLQLAVVEDNGQAPPSGQVKLRVLHGAFNAPPVDLFVTSPTQDLPTTPTIAGLAFSQQAPAQGQSAIQIPAGSYRVRARASGSQSIVYDSGAINLPSGADIVLVAEPDPGPSNSIIQLLQVDSASNSAFLRDQRANLRVGHFSPNITPVDVFLKSPGQVNSAQNRVLSNVPYPNDSGYLSVDAGTYDASASLTGSLTGALNLNGASLARASSTSLFAVGLLNGSGAAAAQLRAYPDDRTPVAGQAKVRVIHLAPDAPVAVDVVTLDAGGAITGRPVTNLSYPNATASPLLLPPGTYRLGVVPTGATTPILPNAQGVSVSLAAGDVRTVLALGLLNPQASNPAGVENSPFQLRVLNDL